MTKCLIPGSFDPITVGHLDVIFRAAKLFDKVVVSVMNNPKKKCVFTLDERMKLIRKSVGNQIDLEVTCFEGLMVEYAKKNNIDVVIRGLRAVSDFDYEFQLGALNSSLCPEIETVYLMTDKKYSFLSASMVREIGSFGGDISAFVPELICDEVKIKLLQNK